MIKLRDLGKVLRRYECEVGAEMFRSTVAFVFDQTVPSTWTDEDLLFHPEDALTFCDTVRMRVQCKKLPDFVILKTLVNYRKGGRRKKQRTA